jgi:hypothetical protein
MTREEWEGLKAKGKLVELFPGDLRPIMADDYSYFNVPAIDQEERMASGRRARWLREKVIEVFQENLRRLRAQ